jgi:hypothetical protein
MTPALDRRPGPRTFRPWARRPQKLLGGVITVDDNVQTATSRRRVIYRRPDSATTGPKPD